MRIPCLLLLLGIAAGAQTQTLCGPDPSADKDKSLGEVARQQRKGPASHARIVLNDDDLKPKSPIPDIALDGENNDKEIADAYLAFYETHTRAEIDKTVREWYDDQVGTYNQLREEMAHLQSAQSANYYTAYPYYPGEQPTDPQRIREQQALAQAGAQADQHTMQRNSARMSRIQSSLLRIRKLVDPKGQRYDWFDTYLYQQR